MRKKREKRNGFQSVEEQFERICFIYFCMTKSTKSHLRGSLLEISLSFPALLKREQYTPSCANISSEPPDLGQRQKCRLKCKGVCSTLLCAMPIYGRGSRLAKARSAPRLCQRTDFMHARHTFICGRGTGAYANLLGYFV